MSDENGLGKAKIQHKPCKSLICGEITNICVNLNIDFASTTHPRFDLTGVRTHDLQIMTVHFMSLRHLL